MLVEHSQSRPRVAITEDRSDSLMVPQARTRPGFVGTSNRHPHESYQADYRPQRLHLVTTVNSEVEGLVEGSVVIFQGECQIVLKSLVKKTGTSAVKTWALLTMIGVTVKPPDSVLLKQDGEYVCVTQVYRVSYADSAESGCVVFRCVNENLCFGDVSYKNEEIISFYFYRSREDYDSTPYPPVLTLMRPADQNYVPMVPGQILQVVTHTGEMEIADVQGKVGVSVIFRDAERLTRNGKVLVHRYECVRVCDVNLPFYAKNNSQSFCVIVPAVRRVAGDVFAVVTEPYKTVKVLCVNLTSLRIRFSRNIPIISWPSKFIDVRSADTVNHEIELGFLASIESVIIDHGTGVCAISCVQPGLGTYGPTIK